jgi:hypothetical protein
MVRVWRAAVLAMVLAACDGGGGGGSGCRSSGECAAGESCIAGRCVLEVRDAGPPPACRSDRDCDDGSDCTRDTCDLAADRCVHAADHSLCPAGALCAGAAGCVPGRPCSTDAECDDGLFCNGREACIAGRCGAGAPIECDDRVPCTVDVCDEGANQCAHIPLDARCDDGMWCNGAETCHVMRGCEPGTPPVCDDGFDCTVDSCDEAADRCAATVVAGQCLIEGACRTAGSTAGSDFCRVCDPATSATEWAVSCTASVVDDTHEDFLAGDLGRSVANLYVHASGSVQSVQRRDVDGDGFVDAVIANYYDNSTRRIDSYVYHGSATGISPTGRRTALPTLGALDAAAADLNADGFVDLVFANHHNDSTHRTDSFVYWGSATGFSATARTALPTLGAYAVAVADLDRNGWLDLVFANYYDGASYNTTSYVYLGSAAGFSPASRIALPTVGPLDVCVADFDGDRFLDLLFASYYSGSSYATNSLIYYGSASGPDPMRTTALPTLGARGCAVADLDRDGDLDVLFGNHTNGSTGFVNSRIYLGSATGPNPASFTEFATAWAGRPSIADLDGNGWLDLIVPMAYNGSTHRTNSRVFYRSTGGAFTGTEFYATIGAFDVTALDWNADGHLDLLWTSHVDGSNYRVDSQYFPGSAMGPRATPTMTFPSFGSLSAISTDAGHTYDRGWVEEFVSRVFDLGSAVEPTWIDFDADVPMGTQLRLQVRSAADVDALATAPWRGPGGTADSYYETAPARLPAAHRGHRFVQYRALFRMPNAAASPVLHRVAIHYR